MDNYQKEKPDIRMCNNNIVITIAVTVIVIAIIVVFVKCGYISKFQVLKELGNILLQITSLPLLNHKQSQ